MVVVLQHVLCLKNWLPILQQGLFISLLIQFHLHLYFKAILRFYISETVALEKGFDVATGRYSMTPVNLSDKRDNRQHHEVRSEEEEGPFPASDCTGSRYSCVTNDNADPLSTALERKIECVLLQSLKEVTEWDDLKEPPPPPTVVSDLAATGRSWDAFQPAVCAPHLYCAAYRPPW